ncbi:MAG: EFR1 family ferrodoxin [Paramuribaculum sp.]|nr:EFR1 family ferrodoxin [Paramuribaculum sp.]
MRIYEIYFSPTGGTKKVADALVKGLGHESTHIELSDNATATQTITLSENDIAVIAVPSYSGRVPSVAIQRLSNIKANGAKAIVVAVYGNRAYEDTLVELQDATQLSGFVVIGAIAAIAEHSIAHKYATGRPDTNDLSQLKEFSRKINAKLSKGDSSCPAIPGNRPYRKASNTSITPVAITKKCMKCGLCSVKCPVGAIDKNNPTKVNKEICISCMRCVSFCPHNARKINSILQYMINLMLKKACSIRKEYELYL